MHKRNLLSVMIVMFIIIGATIATIITIRDFDAIREDFNDFTTTPLFPDNPIDPDDEMNEGVLNLLYTSIIGEENESEVFGFSSTKKSGNQSEQITNILFEVTSIRLIGKNVDNATFLDVTQSLDLYQALSTEILIDASNISSGEYSAIQINFESIVTIITNTGEYEFTISGADFLTISFNKLSNPGKRVNLDIEKNSENEVVLEIDVKLMWAIESVNLLMNASITA